MVVRACVGIAFLLLLGTVRAGERELGVLDGFPEPARVEGKCLLVEEDVPEGTWWLRAVRVWVHVRTWAEPEPIEVRVLDARNEVLGRGYASTHTLESREPGWHRIELPSPPRVTGRIRIAFDCRAVRDARVEAAWCATDGGATRSWLLADEGEAPFPDGTWVIHPILVDDRTDVMEIGPDGVPGETRPLATGTWFATELKKPVGTWWLRAVRLLLHSSPYLREGELRVRITTSSGRTLFEEQVEVLGAEGHVGWVEVPIRARLRAPGRFRVAVRAADDVEWGELGQVAHDATSRSFDFAEGKPRHREKLPKGRDHGIRAVLAKEAAHAGVDAWVEDLEFVLTCVHEHRPRLPERSEPEEAAAAMRRRWKKVVERSKDDREHVLTMMQVLADLEDGHARLTPSDPAIRNPVFDGYDGAGLWIAWQKGRMTLRGIAPDHPLADRLKPGAVLTHIGGRPARLVNTSTIGRMRAWLGWSTLWQLQAALATRFFPFGEKEELVAGFLDGRGKAVEVTLKRSGPPDLLALTSPPGVEVTGLVAAGMLDDEIAYLRILGGMDEATSAALDTALAKVKRAKALVLDARGAGDGEERWAAAMAGRFRAKEVEGPSGPIVGPTGAWQYGGAVVLLLDERMAGAAESFALLLTARGRAITVGGPTAGSLLVPRTFRAPSGLFTFTMGHRTGVRAGDGLMTEGDRLAGEVPIAWWPGVFERSADPPLAVGADILRLILAGVDRRLVVRAYSGCLAPSLEAFASARKFEALEKPGKLAYDDLYPDVFEEHTRWLRWATEHPADPMPAFGYAAFQIRQMGMEPPATWEADVRANLRWNELLGLPLELLPLTLRAFLLVHEESRYGRAILADPVFSRLAGR